FLVLCTVLPGLSFSAFPSFSVFFFFFFQAEDGIRDFHVTGVQTCALPICGAGETGRPGRQATSGHVSGLYRRLHRDAGGDRKSTRLNSSHVKISYAVFCLKKKKILSFRS